MHIVRLSGRKAWRYPKSYLPYLTFPLFQLHVVIRSNTLITTTMMMMTTMVVMMMMMMMMMMIMIIIIRCYNITTIVDFYYYYVFPRYLLASCWRCESRQNL